MGGGRAKIYGLRLHLDEAETICSRFTDEAEASSFDIRSKGGVKTEIRRALEAEADRRGVIKSEARTG